MTNRLLNTGGDHHSASDHVTGSFSSQDNALLEPLSGCRTAKRLFYLHQLHEETDDGGLIMVPGRELIYYSQEGETEQLKQRKEDGKVG